MNRKKKRNQGIITIPFLLVLVIILFFTLAFLMLTMTFAHVTVTQYLTFSSARKLSLAGNSQSDQVEAALLQYETLRAQFFKPSAHTGKTGDWFYIQSQLEKKEQQYTVQGDYPENNNALKRFYGVNTRFQSRALNLKIPFLIEEDSNELNKAVRISSFLGREPSKAECEKFHKNKRTKIQTQCSNNNCPNIQEPKKPEGAEGDNGC